jgi:hypothetical protein
MGPISLCVLHYTRLEKLARYEPSCILGPFVSYKEKGNVVNTTNYVLKLKQMVKLYIYKVVGQKLVGEV